ncbi:hypothetical protein CW745_04445 [Psychromonas sp. psych-6C06]|uniref:hypothetical protein n=1 Tax=Psychromonas sp. psych-6C06 TaxID=2058089 RepID=UPI000C342076|nr:hypothetical protein [Psychromonas sp. psych-6C06]PKF62679.1 hypothetical protein CW745_04445 [Psychromonas sp. psych-6C06]
MNKLTVVASLICINSLLVTGAAQSNPHYIITAQANQLNQETTFTARQCCDYARAISEEIMRGSSIDPVWRQEKQCKAKAAIKQGHLSNEANGRVVVKEPLSGNFNFIAKKPQMLSTIHPIQLY